MNLRAEVKRIIPSNRSLDWNELEAGMDQRDAFSTFFVDVGLENDPGSDMFVAGVATRAAASRARAKGEPQYPGFIVDDFNRVEIERTIKSFVSAVTGADWASIVESLRQRMDWEYEAIPPLRDRR